MKRTETEVRATLRRLLANGPLTVLPRRAHDLEVFLTLAAARFEPQRAYSEAQVNDLLQAWLEPFCSRFSVDHVTVRRCLVDARLLLRDRAGSTYKLAADPLSVAIGVEPATIMVEVQRERKARKRAHSARPGR